MKVGKMKRLMAVLVSLMLVMGFASVAAAADDGKININTATVEELTQLKKVGPKYAEKIVEYRKAEPFAAPEDIMNVPGIGEKTFEMNKDRIVVE